MDVRNETGSRLSKAGITATPIDIVDNPKKLKFKELEAASLPRILQDVDAAAADPLAADNVMYALHFYAATHKDDLRAKAAKAIDAGLPLFVTEFGICDASGNGAIDEAQAGEWVSFLDGHGVSYVMWNLSNKAESSAMFKATCDKLSGFQDSDLSQAGAWLKRVLSGPRLGSSGRKRVCRFAFGG